MLLNSVFTDRNARTPIATAWHRIENKRVCFVWLFYLECLQDSCHPLWLSSFTKQASWSDALKEIHIHARLLLCLESYRSFGYALENTPSLLTLNNTHSNSSLTENPLLSIFSLLLLCVPSSALSYPPCSLPPTPRGLKHSLTWETKGKKKTKKTQKTQNRLSSFFPWQIHLPSKGGIQQTKHTDLLTFLYIFLHMFFSLYSLCC